MNAPLWPLDNGGDALMRLRLAAEIATAIGTAIGRPMTWGRDDCALFIADIYVRALGKDPASAFRRRYFSMVAAHALLGHRGLAYAWMRAARRLGWIQIEAAEAEVGDLGLVRTPEGCSSVICNGATWVGRVSMGFAAVPSEAVVMAWRVA